MFNQLNVFHVYICYENVAELCHDDFSITETFLKNWLIIGSII